MGLRVSGGNGGWRAVASLAVLFCLWGGTGQPSYAGDAHGAAKTEAVVQVVPPFELPIPSAERDRSYLGLTGEGVFTPAQVDAKVLLVEVFSFYCPHCQRSAPKVNDLYARILAGADTRGKVKLIGIGASNSPFEVKLFKDKYGVEFPLFADEDMRLTRLLNVRFTPTFIGIRQNRDGRLERFYFREDGSWSAEELLAELVKASETEKESRQ